MLITRSPVLHHCTCLTGEKEGFAGRVVIACPRMLLLPTAICSLFDPSLHIPWDVGIT